MKSLKARLLLWVCGSAAGVMIAAAIVLFVLARSYQISQLDRGVREKARLIVSMIEIKDDSIQLEFEELDMRDFETAQAGWYLQVWLENESIYRSKSFQNRDLGSQPFGRQSSTVTWTNIPGDLNGRGLLLVYDLANDFLESPMDKSSDTPIPAVDGESPFTLSVFLARDATETMATLRYLGIGLWVVTAVAILLVAVILTTVVNHSMRPVDILASRIQQIDATDLNANIHTVALPTELEPIVIQFNALLSRLNAAFERERGFCADVAHELRTPLSGLRATLDVTMARPRTDQQYSQALGQCHRIVVETQELINSLLQIAKLETGQIALHPEPVDLSSQMQEIWNDVLDKHSKSSQSFDIQWQLTPNLEAHADRTLLQIILRNLFENAIEYVDQAGQIRLETSDTPQGIQVEVTNTGCQITAEDSQLVFDRFWRGSESRTGSGAHFGLGLSLAERASKNLGGTLTVEAELGGTFRAICLLSGKI